MGSKATQAITLGVSAAVLIFAAMLLVDSLEPAIPLVAGVFCFLLVMLFPSGVLSSVRRDGWILVIGYFLVMQLILTFQLVAFLTGKFSIFYSRPMIWVWNVLSVPTVGLPYLLNMLGMSDLGELAFFAVPTVNSVLVALTIGAVRQRHSTLDAPAI